MKQQHQPHQNGRQTLAVANLGHVISNITVSLLYPTRIDNNNDVATLLSKAVKNAPPHHLVVVDEKYRPRWKRTEHRLCVAAEVGGAALVTRRESPG